MGKEIAKSGAGTALNLNDSARPRQEFDIPVRVASYAGLLKEVRLAMAGGRKRAEEAVERERVRTAWEIGKLIDAHVLLHEERADYAQYVLPKLAKDLATSRTELYYMLEFARTYPIVPHAGQLSWSDYRDLLVVNIPEKRKALTEQAEKENWSRERLRKEVKAVTRKGTRHNALAGKQALLGSGQTPTPGKPGTYRVILAKAGPFAGELAIDLGFSNYLSLEAVFSRRWSQETAKDSGGRRGVTTNEFKDRDIVRGDWLHFQQKGQAPFPKEKEPVPAKMVPVPLSENDLYTYEAFVYAVLDGDTVNAVVDLGFGFVTTQTLRLRGIDAPEIMTADGVEAKKALERMLESAVSVQRSADSKNKGHILVKTSKSDKYDRYLADIFIAGVYANQKLVDDGYAVIVEE